MSLAIGMLSTFQEAKINIQGTLFQFRVHKNLRAKEVPLKMTPTKCNIKGQNKTDKTTHQTTTLSSWVKKLDLEKRFETQQLS